MNDKREGVHNFRMHHDLHFNQIRGRISGMFIVKGGIAFRERLQFIVEIADDFCERKIVMQRHAGGRQVFHVVKDAAPFLAELHDRPHKIGRHDDRRGDIGFEDFIHLSRIRELGRIVQTRMRSPPAA